MATSGLPGKTPGMSSRLANMKFMQRGAPVTPPSNNGSPLAKRQKVDDGSATSAGRAVSQSPVVPIEDARREQLLARQAEQAGDSKWTLGVETAHPNSNGGGLVVIDAGYSFIDSGRTGSRAMAQEAEDGEDEAEEDDSAIDGGIVGRKSFGKFNKALENMDKKRKRGNSPGAGDGGSSDSSGEGSDDEDESEEHVDDDDEDEDEDNPTKASSSQAAEHLRAKRKAKKKEDRAYAEMLAERRRSKEVKLNKISSISSGGGSRGGGMGSKGGRGSSHNASRRDPRSYRQ